ncbi:MAG: MFS transporter [Ardenticatenaceae bacterium]|nr:MFS transporter [Ardenticatenaceae bacterium]MCB9005613.1 MFS transporter [Ardenticatenaceae bacterium]
MNKQREITGWAMYDWANSAFSTTVVTAFLGPYLAALIAASPEETLQLGAYAIEADAFYPFCVSISVILQVLFLPFLGALADYTNLKKRLLLLFAYIGATATMLLVFVQGNLALLGGLLFIVANFSFGAGVVFYNAYLPDLATPQEQDSISSKGFAYGYVGGGLLLALNLALFQLVDDTAVAVRLSLGSAGLWWLLFTWLYPQRRLVVRRTAVPLPANTNPITHSLHQFFNTLREMKNQHPLTLRFLLAYLIYNDGIQTVNTVAAIFAASEIGMGPEQLVGVILLIQFVAAIGAILFNRLAQRIGAKATVILTLIGWTGLIVYAFGWLQTPRQVWSWAFFEALVLGSSQALSRSMFAKMTPRHQEAAYFSLYEISERGTSWIGPLVFGLTVQLTGSSRTAMLPIIAFFAFGILVLLTTDLRQAITAAGNEAPALV